MCQTWEAGPNLGSDSPLQCLPGEKGSASSG